MSPVLAGLLPLIITAALAGVAFLLAVVFAAVMLLRQARGEYEPDNEEDESDTPNVPGQ
jgi:hypothetical protein